MPSIHVKETVPEEEVEQAPESRSETKHQLDNPDPTPPNSGGSQYEGMPAGSPFRFMSRKLIIFYLILLVVVTGAVLSLVNDRRELKKKVNDLSTSKSQTPTADEAEAENLKKEIGQYLQLPADETPTVATVVDASKVKNQSFFANAENGDKVLLFAKSGKAILYRPSTKKIIEVAPINLNQTETPAVTPNAQPTTPTKTTR